MTRLAAIKMNVATISSCRKIPPPPPPPPPYGDGVLVSISHNSQPPDLGRDDKQSTLLSFAVQGHDRRHAPQHKAAGTLHRVQILTTKTGWDPPRTQEFASPGTVSRCFSEESPDLSSQLLPASLSLAAVASPACHVHRNYGTLQSPCSAWTEYFLLVPKQHCVAGSKTLSTL